MMVMGLRRRRRRRRRRMDGRKEGVRRRVRERNSCLTLFRGVCGVSLAELVVDYYVCKDALIE
jgi:hypothetical protein